MYALDKSTVKHLNNDKFENVFNWSSGLMEFQSGVRMRIDNAGNFYLLSRDIIWKYDKDGHLLTKLIEEGMEPGQIVAPIDISVDTAENIYLLDLGNNRVQKFKKVH